MLPSRFCGPLPQAGFSSAYKLPATRYLKLIDLKGSAYTDCAWLRNRAKSERFPWFSEEEPIPERSMKRLGLFLGIYKGLVEVTPSRQEKLAFEWFQRNTSIFPDFPGQSIRDYLLENPTEEALRTAFFSVRSLNR